jgi:hypothetical protein
MPQAALPFNLSVIALIMFQGVRLHSDGGCRTRQGKASMFNRTQLVVCSFLVAFFLVGCRVNAPEKGSEAINLMTRYNQEGRHDDALKVAQDWMKKHPEQHAHLRHSTTRLQSPIWLRPPRTVHTKTNGYRRPSPTMTKIFRLTRTTRSTLNSLL